MDTIYRKVEIKSEQDLPKKDGFYIASCKDYAVLEYHYCSEVQKDWLKEVDWYLQPVEPQEPNCNHNFKSMINNEEELP